MPKKQSTVQKQENTQVNETTKVEYKITPQSFDTKRLYFKARPLEKEEPQQMCFPKYLYEPNLTPSSKTFETNGKALLLVTGGIKIIRGGIPRHSERWHLDGPNDKKRAFFYLPHDPTNPECVALFNTFRQIDDYMEREINEKKNANSVLCFDKKGVRTKFPGCTYKRIITTAEGPKTLDFDDDDDADTANKSKKPFVPYERVKVRLSMLYEEDENTKKAVYKGINTQVYVKDNTTAEETKNITDIEKYLTWNSTVMFALMLNKVWIQTRDEKNCGISIKCIQMCMLDTPEFKQKSVGNQLNERMFARVSVNPTPTTKETKKESSEEGSSDDEEEDDEDENDNSDDDNSEPESEEEKQPVVVKNKNTGVKNDKKTR